MAEVEVVHLWLTGKRSVHLDALVAEHIPAWSLALLRVVDLDVLVTGVEQIFHVLARSLPHINILVAEVEEGLASCSTVDRDTLVTD